MTYSWGDTYKLHKAEGSVIGPGQLGVYPTPGSTRVLDRGTMKLVPCTKELCKHGKYYEDLGWVNHAPYLANGGWSGAVSANADAEKQLLMIEFLLFACAKQQAQKGVIPKASTPWERLNSQDPFRKSQLEVGAWVDQGYDSLSARNYQETVLEGALSDNLAVDMRTPMATEIMGVLDKIVHAHLIEVRDRGAERHESLQMQEQRIKVMNSLNARWLDLIQTYDARGDTDISILEIYQRLRGVYVAKVDLNQLTAIRPLGWTMLGVVYASLIACGVWVYVSLDSSIVKAAQPFFLYLILGGLFVMSSSIIPMAIDDAIASTEGCTMACNAVPWLFFTGFTLTFSALFSKVWRLNCVWRNAAKFQRIEITTRDVLPPLVVMMSLNITFLAGKQKK